MEGSTQMVYNEKVHLGRDIDKVYIDMSAILVAVFFTCLLTAVPMFRHFLTAQQALYEGVQEDNQG